MNSEHVAKVRGILLELVARAFDAEIVDIDLTYVPPMPEDPIGSISLKLSWWGWLRNLETQKTEVLPL